ncbi:PqqD family protein [Emticicia sp. 17c]|uniref:PqqD family protein n=1 Tax=Emticicia sp. 17c TaxID=3127704 RepID=UPI00301D6DBF
MNLTKAIQRKSENVLITNLGDELVMMHLETGNYITLNNLARVIWEKIENPVTADELIAYLLSKYNVSETQCKHETYKFLDSLQAQGLLL